MAYLAAKFAAIIIQERYRAKKLGDQERQRYKRINSAAVVIQAAYRGCMVRRRMAERHRAAAIIQRMFLTIQTELTAQNNHLWQNLLWNPITKNCGRE
uniref:Uncharacterized protein n=1 Tax=Oryzias latipes TaxID=8090 RepID=A0A3P9H3T1_ORYLA